ncbi:hypothetical protein IMZ08_16410 [Bacillus luteolus]|uniref:Uncharacterized protein n=1 Tax=Litchfieldia luteola TaxID=682179 RepID=A0ABR9QMB0_9BACI|nr:CBO0543 family protein [Cytobacillus luteolus]MBE4909637.1 hypothetical protein [Cytobacillus luteolus]MBP1941038.1 hypothetical protein [Cytobacillus luteolus]
MSIDFTVILAIWVIFPLILYFAVPRDRVREMIAVFLFFQMLTWLFSIVMTKFGVLSAPIREFPEATKINFSSEYIVFPTAAVLFQRWYPENGGKIRQALHYLYTVGGIILFLFIIGRTTDLMEAKPQTSAINFLFELMLCRKYIMWMLKGEPFTKSLKRHDVI